MGLHKCTASTLFECCDCLSDSRDLRRRLFFHRRESCSFFFSDCGGCSHSLFRCRTVSLMFFKILTKLLHLSFSLLYVRLDFRNLGGVASNAVFQGRSRSAAITQEFFEHFLFLFPLCLN